MSDQVKTGGCAFPCHPMVNPEGNQSGMTLRDYLAGQALVALLTHRDIRDTVANEHVAAEAYGYADAMVARSMA